MAIDRGLSSGAICEALEERQLLSGGTAEGAALLSVQPRLAVRYNINASRSPGGQAETKIAINPRNSSNIVVVSTDANQNASGLLVMRSNNGGASWTRQSLGARQDGLNPRGGRVDPHVTFDRFGNCYITYIAGVSPNQTNLVVARSSNGGASFSTRTIGYAGFIADSPSIAAGPYASSRGREAIWVSYTNEGSGRIEAVRAVATGLGRTGLFTKPIQVSRRGGGYSIVDVGPRGQVVVSWQTPENGWAPSQIFTAANPRGTFGGFTGDRFATWTNVGSETTLPAQPNRGVDAEAALAFARSGRAAGRLYLVYTDARSANSPDMNITLRFSDDSGATWGPPTPVSDGSGAAFLPAMAVDPASGNIGVTWYDTRSSRRDDKVQLYGAISTDAGYSFGGNFRISAGASSWTGTRGVLSGFDFGDYTGVAFRNGKLMPAWADNSNSTGDNPGGLFDIYMSVIRV